MMCSSMRTGMFVYVCNIKFGIKTKLVTSEFQVSILVFHIGTLEGRG